MEVLQAIILGITQGLTEFIPVSSSGHLILVGHFLNFKYSGLGFDTALDIGTLAALYYYFRHDILKLLKGLVRKTEDSRTAWLIAAATVPGVLAGIALQHAAETIFRSAQLVAMNLIWVGILMYVIDRYAPRKLQIDQLKLPTAVGIGVAQAIALVPGVSRSGITITAGRLFGMDRVAATRFSFLLSAPIITGATLKVITAPHNFAQLTSAPGIYAIGIISAALSGYWAIRFMITYLAKHGLGIFAAYRIAVGVLIIMIGLQ